MDNVFFKGKNNPFNQLNISVIDIEYGFMLFSFRKCQLLVYSIHE